MSGITFQSHSQYSTDIARAWRTDNVQQDILKGTVEDSTPSPAPKLVRQPSRTLITPDDKDRIFEVQPSSSSSSSSSCSTTIVDPLTLLISKIDGLTTQIGAMNTKIDNLRTDVSDLRRVVTIQNKQINNLVDMSCPDKFLSLIICGYSKQIKDNGLTDSDKSFLESGRVTELQSDRRE